MDGSNLNTSSEYLISIVVPCYNCQSTLELTMKSLLWQEKNASDTDRAFYQIVLVDDGSSDETPKMCDKFATLSHVVEVIHKENGGLVSAWKAGVRGALGDYIAFCDADDYIDKDFIGRISKIVYDNHPDIIVFGMTTEYDNGDIVRGDCLLKEGLYDRYKIENALFPVLLNNGDMQSELLMSSRCNKVFRKKLLFEILEDVPDEISFGEDDVTCFAAELNCQSLFCIRNYYPYHYIRNVGSMIGAYDELTFEKIEYLYNSLWSVAEKYDYNYSDQVKQDILSIYFLYIKKEICKNPFNYKKVKEKLLGVIASRIFVICYNDEAIKKYGLAKKVFAKLIISKNIGLAYFIMKLFERLRGRNV